VNASQVDATSLLAYVWLAWGTADVEFTDCRLVKQDIPRGQNGLPFESPNLQPPRLERVYEQISATAEQQVGNTDISIGQDNLVTASNTFLQFATAPATYGHIGVDSITAGTTLCILKSDERTDDGTLRTIKRTYISAGQISQTDETKNGGKLLIRSIKSVYTVPATPSGYTLIRQDVQYISGLPVYDYTFANGSGEISRDSTTTQGGPYSVDGAVPSIDGPGATVWTIRHLTASSVSANPTSAPLEGAVCVSLEKSDQDGYRIWTARWALGYGLVVSDVSIKNGGKLYLYHRVFLGSQSEPSFAPSASIGGTVTLVDKNLRYESGYSVYDWTWAEGVGEISLETSYQQSSNEGTTGVTRVTIRQLTAGTQATRLPATLSGYVNIGQEYSDQDGYRIWTTIWAKGTGTVSQRDDTRNNGALLLRTLVALGSAPATPSGYTLVNADIRADSGHTVYTSTFAQGSGEIGRTVDYLQSSDQGTTGVTRTVIRYLTSPSVTSDPTSLSGSVKIGEDIAEQDGHRVWTVTYANGTGTVISTVRTENYGKMVRYRIVALGSAPSAPSNTIGGTVTLIESAARADSGYVVYDYAWAEGCGVVRKAVQHLDGGLRIETWVSLGVSYDSSYMLPAGILKLMDEECIEGVRQWSVSCIQTSAGGNPTVGTALTYEIKHPFTYPGRAKAVTIDVNGKNNYDVYKSPAVTTPISAVVKVSYQSSSAIPTLTYTLWAPTTWATIFAKYWSWSSYPKGIIESLPGYRSVSETAITFNGTTSGYNEACMGDRVYGIGSGTPYSLQVVGGPSAPDGNTYTLSVDLSPAFVGYDGTQYYRLTVVEATIPTQTALPV